MSFVNYKVSLALITPDLLYTVYSVLYVAALICLHSLTDGPDSRSTRSKTEVLKYHPVDYPQ